MVFSIQWILNVHLVLKLNDISCIDVIQTYNEITWLLEINIELYSNGIFCWKNDNVMYIENKKKDFSSQYIY